MARENYKKSLQYWLLPHNLEKIKGWLRDGLTESSVCQKMGINTVTFWRWKNKNKMFLDVVLTEKESVDYLVESSLLRRAVGYDYEETIYDANGNVRSVTTKHVPPDTKACFLWLKNRRPDKWRNVQQIEANMTSCVAQQMKELSVKELRQLASITIDVDINEDDDDEKEN